ncbi:FAD-dependent oxidoreductase [Clostridiaceae bacterium OttesenSCG-928-D20]|nr:FAD-dependent oxidoreductase [Clostridiaceae bacterium OttesenSCG-928-D20]
MKKVVIIGGGWAGVSAAITATNAGGNVILLERSDMLLGTGLVGGIMRNNGRYTATEEAIAMGADEIFEVIDSHCRHKNIEFPGHKHASLYDIALIEPAIKELLIKKGIDFRLRSRVKDVQLDGDTITGVVLDSGEVIDGDVFIETTGTAGPQNNCTKYGNGCAMCALRCPSFGGRVSVASKAGISEKMGKKQDGSIGAMSGSCKLLKESLSPEIVRELNETGVCVVPIPEHLRKGEAILATKACQQYALKEFAENIVLLDTGHAKLMSPFYPLDMLRQIPGFEDARYEDPYSGGLGNSMRYMALSPRDNALKVVGLKNLFCGGEKAGLLVGHTEAIVTGALAGHNAVRWLCGKELLQLPETLCIGDAIVHVNKQMQTEAGMGLKYTFSGANYFVRMKELRLYSTDDAEIKARVEAAGLTNIFHQVQ